MTHLRHAALLVGAYVTYEAGETMLAVIAAAVVIFHYVHVVRGPQV